MMVYEVPKLATANLDNRIAHAEAVCQDAPVKRTTTVKELAIARRMRNPEAGRSLSGNRCCKPMSGGTLIRNPISRSCEIIQRAIWFYIRFTL